VCVICGAGAVCRRLLPAAARRPAAARSAAAAPGRCHAGRAEAPAVAACAAQRCARAAAAEGLQVLPRQVLQPQAAQPATGAHVWRRSAAQPHAIAACRQHVLSTPAAPQSVIPMVVRALSCMPHL
jgi:hypothetical protein